MVERRRQTHTDHLSLLLLLAQLWQQIEHLPVKPVVTLALNGFMVAAHVEPLFIPFLNYSIHDMCLGHAQIVWSFGSGDFVNVLLRFFGAAFVHGSDYHLYYNCASFLWKGSVFETRLGPGPFAVLVMMLLVLAHASYLIAGILMQSHQCTIGFSGVVFALVRSLLPLPPFVYAKAL